MKTFFIVPGFRMQASHKMFSWLVKYLESKNYKVVKVPIKWNYNTLTRNAKELEEFFIRNKGRRNYILGFSYGAVITLLTATTLKPEKIYLCSLSPDFKEDLPMDKWSRNYIGKKRYEDVKTRSGKEFARTLTIPSVVFYGEKEGKKYPDLKKRCEETAKLARNSKVIKVKDAPHDLSYPTYIEAIKREIK